MLCSYTSESAVDLRCKQNKIDKIIPFFSFPRTTDRGTCVHVANACEFATLYVPRRWFKISGLSRFGLFDGISKWFAADSGWEPIAALEPPVTTDVSAAFPPPPMPPPDGIDDVVSFKLCFESDDVIVWPILSAAASLSLFSVFVWFSIRCGSGAHERSWKIENKKLMLLLVVMCLPDKTESERKREKSVCLLIQKH